MNTQSSIKTEFSPVSYSGELPAQPLTTSVLRQQNLAFQGTGGVSAGNRSQGFVPAFLDTETGMIHLARYADGRPAPLHLLDGLPQELVVNRDAAGRCVAASRSLIAGFVQAGLFYTREQAARCV